MSTPDRYRPDVPRPGAHPVGWDLDRVDSAPWPWEPRREVAVPVPGWANYNSGPAFGGHPLDQAQHRRTVTKSRRETRHGLHLLLTLCTFGVWAFTGWPVAWAWNRFGPRRVTTTYAR
jgi:hypothetical protein